MMPSPPVIYFLRLIWVILLLATTSGACVAASWNPNDTEPYRHDVKEAANRAVSSHCGTPSCKAIEIIDSLTDIVATKYANVNGDELYSVTEERIAARHLNNVLLDHPNMFRSVCQTSASLLSRFHNAPQVPDFIVPIQLLINGVDMDIRDHCHCVADLIKALPAEQANNEVRLNAHTLCVTDDDNHRRTRAECDRLIPGLTDPGTP